MLKPEQLALLKDARQRAGLKQCEAADRSGVSMNTLARWERGEMAPSYEALRLWARAVGLEARILLLPDDLDRLIAPVEEAELAD